MNTMRKGWNRMAIAVRVAAVALVLACLASQRMEARAPVAASGGEGAPPAGLSAEDWSTIRARLAQAGAHAPLVTSEVTKLTADDAAESDFFGTSVSISGDTVVVGAEGDDGFTGSVYVFERNRGGADDWGQVARLTASDAAVNDSFGYAVSTSGDTVVVGARHDDDGGDDSGSAYVFERNQGGADNWGQVQKLTASDAEAGDRFGYAVAISGDTVVVGARYDDDGGGASGSAYVFERNYNPGDPGTPLADNWGEVQKLTAADAAQYDQFGYAVAISGDTVVVGARSDDDGGDASGSAYVFERNYNSGDPGTPLADNWGEVQKLTAADAAAGDNFGESVSVSGDTVVVGAIGDDDWGSASGSAYVFERNRGGPDGWGQVQKMTADDAAQYDRLGYAVTISGNIVVTGAPFDSDGGLCSGSAYVFARHGVAWVQQQKPVEYDPAAYGHFGTSVAIAGDAFIAGAPDTGDSGVSNLFYRNQGGADQWGEVAGHFAIWAGVEFGASVAIDVDTAIVGAPNADRAYIFERNEGGADLWWTVKDLFGPSDSDFGNSVGISGDMAVVGASLDDTACADCGAAYVYERNYDPGNPGTPLADNWGLRAVLTAYDAAADDQFGWSVAISGDTVVVGAHLDTHGGGEAAGSVYVFKRNYDWDHPAVPKADNWGLVRKLTADDAAEKDQFGHAVAISGDTFVVGAPVDDDGAGSAYVFERNHDWNDGWGQVEKLTADDVATGDVFGWSVGISGDTVVVGAPYDDDGGGDSGSVYLFKRNEGGADNWGQVEKLTADDAAAGDGFGWSVAISGNAVVVGAPYDDDGGNAAGSTYVFRWTAAAVYLPLVVKD